MKRITEVTVSATLFALMLLSPIWKAQGQVVGPARPAGIARPASDRVAAARAPAPAVAAQRFEKDGVAIEFSIQSMPGEGPPATAGGSDKGSTSGLVAGRDAVATLRVTDARTGQPLVGLHPNAWINSRQVEQPPNEAECKSRISSFAGGLLSVRANVDLNSYTSREKPRAAKS
jgi:hypothetical protein